jgi:hypothetical protein
MCLVVMEPTCNAWVLPLAAGGSGFGADMVLVAPERSADLRHIGAIHRLRAAGQVADAAS